MGSHERLLGPHGIVEVGSVSDQRLGALAPSTIAAGSWWSAHVGDPGPAVTDAHEVSRQPTRTHLAAVRQVLHEAATVVTWETDDRRGAFVVGPDSVLVDRIDTGHHHLSLAELPVAVTLLAIGLDPHDVARHRVRDASPVRLPADQVAGAVPPPSRRRSLLRLARVSVGPPATETALTVIGTDAGVEAWRATADGGVVVARLDRDGVVAASLALLGGPAAVVAA